MTVGSFLLLAAIAAVVCALLAQQVGDPERRNLSLWLGLLLGPIGVVVPALVAPQDRATSHSPVPDLGLDISTD